MKKLLATIDIKGFIIKHKKISILCVSVVLLLGSAIWGLRYYHIQRSPEKALEKITLALQKGNRTELATLVDFRSLSEHFSAAIVAEYNSDNIPSMLELADALQQQVLEGLNAKPEDSSKPVKADPYAPLKPFPLDTLAQIATTLQLETAEENFALLRAKVDYPRAEKKFALVLQMNRTASGAWRISKVVNALEIVRAFMESEASIAQQKSLALAEKNAEQRKRMEEQLIVHSCTALADYLSDEKTALLTIEILGRNPGPHAIHSFNIEASLTGTKPQDTPSVFLLNLAKRTLQGENFAHTWNITLDLQKPEHIDLLQEKKLHCATRFNNMALGSGEVLFVRKNMN